MTWEPIETAPKDGTRVLVAGIDHSLTDGPTVASYQRGPMFAERHHWFNECDMIVKPTHWMPLPEPPAQQDHPTMVSDGGGSPGREP